MRVSACVASCMTGLAVLVLLPGRALGAAPGAGAEFDNSSANYEPPPTVRRGGFAMAINQGFGVGEYRGYPLTFEALSDPDGERTTGPAFATNFNLWLGVGLRDWLTVGLGLSALGAYGQNNASNLGILFHAEAFPLFAWGGFYQDLGLAFDGGIGASLMAASDDTKFEDPIAEGGAMSTLSFSAFWEPLRFWHFSAGPQFSYVYAFSQTMQVNQATLGFRMSLYGVQPAKKDDADTATFGTSAGGL
jgi:hypothetical protein